MAKKPEYDPYFDIIDSAQIKITGGESDLVYSSDGDTIVVDPRFAHGELSEIANRQAAQEASRRARVTKARRRLRERLANSGGYSAEGAIRRNILNSPCGVCIHLDAEVRGQRADPYCTLGAPTNTFDCPYFSR